MNNVDVIDWKVAGTHAPWLRERTIYLTKHGSQAYGTSLPTSDLDLRGICIAPREYYHGFDLKFEQYAPKAATKAEDDPPDLCIFELRKFMKLSAVCNPNALEIIFTSPEDHLFVTPLAEKLFENRNLFLSRMALRTFSGYATGQMHRIEGHYRWIKDPPKAPPQRADFKLSPNPEIPTNQMEAISAGIQKQLDRWNLNFLQDLEPAYRIEIKDAMFEMLAEMQIHQDQLWVGAARMVFGFNDNFIEYLARERSYQAAVKTWKSYQNWLKTRNEARAALERKYHFDTKHAMHLVRLLRMCREVLTTGTLTVKRPDAEELLAIRHGAWTYDQLVEWSNVQYRELTKVALTSILPAKPDNRALDRLCLELVEASF